jgi:hypothetical protein
MDKYYRVSSDSKKEGPQHNPKRPEGKKSQNMQVVFCTGNLWVLLAVPVPVPMKTCTCAMGTGFFMGQFFSYLYLTHTCTHGG